MRPQRHDRPEGAEEMSRGGRSEPGWGAVPRLWLDWRSALAAPRTGRLSRGWLLSLGSAPPGGHARHFPPTGTCARMLGAGRVRGFPGPGIGVRRLLLQQSRRGRTAAALHRRPAKPLNPILEPPGARGWGARGSPREAGRGRQTPAGDTPSGRGGKACQGLVPAAVPESWPPSRGPALTPRIPQATWAGTRSPERRDPACCPVGEVGVQ